MAGSSAIVVKSERHLDTFKAGLKSFVNEARLLARFDHPALVKVYRFWEENGTAYMAMPFYEGPTLKTALAGLGHAPSEAQLRAWLTPLLDALTVMHAAQCFHRDIAPDNILLTATGPLLLDFGAARRVIGDMTHALTVVLKPGYAPIEQYGDVASMTQGAWTDIYALACVVYYAITGKTPMSSVERLMDDRLQPLAVEATGPLRRRLPARDRCRAGGAAAGPAAERGPVPRPARHRPAGAAALAAAERLRRPEPRAVPGDAGQRLLDRAGHADAGAGDAGAGAPGRADGAAASAGGRTPPPAMPPAAAPAMPRSGCRARSRSAADPGLGSAPPPRAGAAGGRPAPPSRVHRASRWSSASASLLVVSGLAFGVYWTLQPGEDEVAKPAAPAASAIASPASAAAPPLSRRRCCRQRARRPRRCSRAGIGTGRIAGASAASTRRHRRQPIEAPPPVAVEPTKPAASPRREPRSLHRRRHARRREPARVEPPAESRRAGRPDPSADLSAGHRAGEAARGAVIFCKRARSSH